MPSDSGAAWSPPASNGERRLSNSSDGSAGSGYSKATTDSADFLATRPHTAGVLPGKPAANPLQFIKVGPADLGCRAREQLRKAELAKRTEPAKIERQEDWQSNLDNWKSSRRKRVEHIIERCVEVRRMENEPSQPRAKSKTFNEMLEERAGRRRRNPLALYSEDDGHDLSDLGIGTSSTKSSLSEDCDTHSLASDGMDLDKNHSDVDNLSNCDTNRKLGSSANDYDTCTTHTISSPEPEEYTYEGAIEGYKSRIISQTNSSIVKTVVSNNFKEKSPEKTNGDVNRIRTSVSNKIEEKMSSFQQERANDAKINNQKKDLPKVDIHKRREQFQRENSQESQTNKPKLPEIANKISIKERLSSLERYSEDTNIQKSTSDLSKLPVEVKPLRERLTSLEKVKSASAEPDKIKRLSNGDLSNTKSLKERLSSLKSQTSEEEVKIVKTEIKEVSMSLKERLSSLDAAKNKEIPKISAGEEIAKTEKADPKVDDMKYDEEINDHSLKSSLSGIENQMQSFCRSFDSLDINGQSSPSSFERVQSFEDFDCAEMQSNTVPSDIETEDSGIHTARDSCAPADDIADLTQVASPIGEPMIEVSEYESSNEDSAICLMPHKIEEPVERVTDPVLTIMEDVIIEEIEEQDSKADTDSGSHYLQAVSQPEELSITEEVTEIQMDKEDEDTLKSLDLADTSVSLTEPVSTGSDGDTVVFEGKMTIHLDLNEICNKINAGAGNNSNNNQTSSTNVSTNSNSMPMVTVSNIITTTNISPKNSIKTLKFANDIHEHTNKLADVKCAPASSTYTPIKVNCSSFKHATSSINHSPTSCNNSDVINCSRLTDNSKNELSVIDALDLAFQELDSEDSFANTSNMADKNKTVSATDSKATVAPLYENIELFYQNGVDGAAAFPLDLPTNVLEPPKEKPPPPPVDDDELLGNGNFRHMPHTSSARRIKKEIRNKRTSFLGIEGQDDSYLDVDLTLAPRPDITSFLQEETKIEKLLYKKTLSHDMDEKLRESRDSGVDFDRGPSAEAWYKGQSSPETSNPHSRQNSEPYTHVTSDEEEASKKKDQFHASLTTKLTDLTDGQTDKIDCLDKKIQHQQACRTNEDWPDGLFDDSHTKEVLRFERELLQLEQEELRRQRDNLLRDQTRIIQKSVQDVSTVSTPEKPKRKAERNDNYRHSMPNLLVDETLKPAVLERISEDKRKPYVSEEHIQRHFGVEESRKVLYVEKMGRQVPPRPPQPILPPKPRSRESVEREITMRSSRVPSAADYVNIERSQPRHHAPTNHYQSMTRHTLQALSAAPTPKLISNAEWLQRQPRKPASYYNQHWLIQEAEQRRLEEARIKLRNTQRLARVSTQHNATLHNNNSKPAVQESPRLPEPPQPRMEPPQPRMEPPQPRMEPPQPRMEPPHRHDEKLLSVSGKRKCSHCQEELGRGAAMIIESLSLCYHVWCFTCGVCGATLGDGRAGADVRVRSNRLHCADCYSSDDGRKYSCV